MGQQCQRRGKRAAATGAAAAAGKPAKVARLQTHNQKRIDAGTKQNPLVLSEGTPQKGHKQQHRGEVAVVLSSDSGRSGAAYQAPNDVRLHPQPPAHRDELSSMSEKMAVTPPEARPNHAAEDGVPRKVKVGNSATYLVHQRLGKGGFGLVYLGRKTMAGMRTDKPARVALKFEKRDAAGKFDAATHEWQMYKEVGDSYGLAKFFAKGKQGEWNIMVMELLGPSLLDLAEHDACRLDTRMLACVAIEAIITLKHLHDRGFVHGDVKPDNFLLSRESGHGGPPRMHLVDLGLAVKHAWGSQQRGYSSELGDFRGTVRYASLHSHLGRSLKPRDDLESLVFTLIYLDRGWLPWMGFQGDEDGKRVHVATLKASYSTAELCSGMDPLLRLTVQQFAEAVFQLNYQDEPDYGAYIQMFEPLADLAAPDVPLRIADPSLRPAKRKAAELLDAASSGPRRRLRQGLQANQYITVLDVRSTPTSQRYHAGVTTAAMEAWVKGGWDKGMYLTSVSSSHEDGKWVLVMTNGRCKHQEYRAACGEFLPRDYIIDKWDEGYYITAIAGQINSTGSLVVMSKGVPGITQQSYKVADSFPTKWVKQKLEDGMFVTAAATCGDQWAIVMSRGAPYLRQVVELDFAYPSDAIRQRWAGGFRITAVAATAVQTAVFMSIHRTNKDYCQETLRDNAWPSSRIKERWDQQKYISSVCYGRTEH